MNAVTCLEIDRRCVLGTCTSLPVSVQAEIRPKVKFKYQPSNSQEFFDVRKGISNRSGKKGSNRGRKLYKKRDSKDFTEDERQHLDDLKKNSLLQKLHVFSVFKEPTEQLKNWLYFFDGNEDSRSYSIELQRGLIQLWSTCIVAVSSGNVTKLFSR